ncbi:MAG TPA: reverse transcriptase-like protein, partial [Actinomycetes bacterium]|nr:reverse transcriptase-like protein [Actinomycetes bacterium]
LVVNQQKGLWKVKNAALRPLSEETARLARTFDRVTWEHVPRERNRHADALANRAMDDQGRVERPGQGALDPEQLRLS